MIEENSQGPGSHLVNALNKSGLPGTIKGRALRLVLRFIAGGPGFELYQKTRERLDVVEGRTRISNIVADELGRQALLDPEFMERAKARFLGDMAHKQENIEAVALKTHDLIASMADADAEIDDVAPEPSQDWLNTFTREAERASSEELRDRLAALLAGEARKPGTFSRSTVRLVAELEKDSLEAFQSVLPRRIGDAIFTDESWNEGPMFTKGVSLEDLGLISGSTGFTNRYAQLDERGVAFVVGNTWVMVFKGETGTKKNMPIWLLTRPGNEIASLLPPTDEREVMRIVAKGIDKGGLTQIYLGPKLRQAEGFIVPTLEILWDREAETAEP